MKITFKENTEEKPLPPFDYGTVWKVRGWLDDLYVASHGGRSGGLHVKILVNITGNFGGFFDDPHNCWELWDKGNLEYVGKISEIVVEKA